MPRRSLNTETTYVGLPPGPAPSTHVYRGTTTRGRETVALSLTDAVSDLAYMAGVPEANAVSIQHDEATWYVYRSQAFLDEDVHVATYQSPTWYELHGSWFAVVRLEARQ